MSTDNPALERYDGQVWVRPGFDPSASGPNPFVALTLIDGTTLLLADAYTRMTSPEAGTRRYVLVRVANLPTGVVP